MTAYLRKSIVVLPLALMLALASGCQLSSTQKNTLIGGTGGALAVRAFRPSQGAAPASAHWSAAASAPCGRRVQLSVAPPKNQTGRHLFLIFGRGACRFGAVPGLCSNAPFRGHAVCPARAATNMKRS